MKIRQLSLKNFRNIEDCDFEPYPQLNFLIGQNAQGKTSFLEALSYLSTLQSFRRAKPHEVIQWGKKTSEIACQLGTPDPELGDWQTHLQVQFQMKGEISDLSPKEKKGTRSGWIDGKLIRSTTEFLSQKTGGKTGVLRKGFHSIVFNPSDHDLVQLDPKLRRSYLNEIIAAEDLDYLKSLKRYQKALEHRNRLLKAPNPPHPDVLGGFSEQLVLEGSLILFRRLQFFERLGKKLQNNLDKIAPKQRPLNAVYTSSWAPKNGLNLNKINNLNPVYFAGQGQLPSLEEIQHVFENRLFELRQVERHVGTTLVGPHRDDWALLLGTDPLKGHGSQGEVRSALLALKLSEIELFRERTGLRPILLLDDFSSELDHERRRFLLRYLLETDLQVFVTTTEEISISEDYFVVQEGSLEKKRSDFHQDLRGLSTQEVDNNSSNLITTN